MALAARPALLPGWSFDWTPAVFVPGRGSVPLGPGTYRLAISYQLGGAWKEVGTNDFIIR